MNRRPCTATSNITPFQLLLGTVLDYSSLRVFGSLCYPNLTATTAHKLCPRSTACVFIGYPDDHRGYRCYDLATKRVITSRHVVFDESQFPFRRPLDRLPSTVPSPAAIIDDTPPVRLQHLVAPAPARVPSTPLASATTPATRSSPGDTASATAQSSPSIGATRTASPPTPSTPHADDTEGTPQTTTPPPPSPPRHHMITRAKAGIRRPHPKYVALAATTTSTSPSTSSAASTSPSSSTSTISPLPSSAHAALRDVN